MNRIQINRLTTVCLVSTLLLATASCGANRTGPSQIDADAPTEFTPTESGLHYRILRKSNGRKPRASDRVKIDYSGWLDDGTIFDSSYQKREPTTFTLAALIDGWTEGLLLIGEGGMIELLIPPELAYGEAGRPPQIPPNATLHFKIELHSIE